MKKFKLLFALMMTIITFSSFAQTSITPKYGVIDMDSVLLTIPEIETIQQRIDSTIADAKKKVEPLIHQIQQKEAQIQQLNASGDTASIRSMQEDIQLLYQEYSLTNQKTNRAIAQLQQDGNKHIDIVKARVKEIGEQMCLTFVIPKGKSSTYNALGLPLLMDSPLYYSGEAIDITDIVIKRLRSEMPEKASNNKTKSKRNRTK